VACEEEHVGTTTRRTTVGVIAMVALLAAALGTQVALAQGDTATDTPPGDLLERLDDLEPTLPGMLPTDVDLEDDETWGTLEGDFGGAAATIDTMAEELRSLFRDADDSEGTVAEAVSNVARGWLDLGEAYDALGEWEAHDLAFPLETADDEGVATGADEVRGDAERGLRHVLRGHQRLLVGYVALREEGAAEDAQAQARLDARAAEAEDFDEEVRPLVHQLLSLSTTEVLRPTERFETDAPGVDARARSMTVTCFDREAYLEMLQGADDAGDLPTPEEISELVGAGQDRIDCPDLPEGIDQGDPLQPTTEADADGDADAEADVDADEDADVDVDVDVEVDTEDE
jgi:hypothetical protein